MPISQLLGSTLLSVKKISKRGEWKEEVSLKKKNKKQRERFEEGRKRRTEKKQRKGLENGWL